MRDSALIPYVVLSMTLFCIPGVAHSRGWAVVVGIDDYEDAGISDLYGADNDAIKLAKTFEDVFYIKDKQDEKHLFVFTSNSSDADYRPKVSNIITKLEYIAQRARPEDLFVMSFAGHGSVSKEGKSYLLTYKSQPSAIEHTALEVGKLLVLIDGINTDKKLLILDTCRGEPGSNRAGEAGALLDRAFVDSFRGFGGIVSAKETTDHKLVKATFFSCSVGQKSYEWSSRKRGFFSYCLEQGLRGKAANPSTGRTTLGDLQAYLDRTVPNEVQIVLGREKRQNPYFRIEGHDPSSWVMVQKKHTSHEFATVLIKPGTFMMGSSGREGGRDRDETRHRVTLSREFYMGVTEVTQGEWTRVMGSHARPWEGRSYIIEGDDYPAVYISWDDAQGFIGKLNESDPTYKYRLPTEDEWEYACRSGSSTAFSWGDSVDCNKANIGYGFSHGICPDNPGTMAKVYESGKNGNSIYGMHGNVWEWCQDSYDSDRRRRVTRGGAWHTLPESCRSANRGSLLRQERRYDQGFRLVRQRK